MRISVVILSFSILSLSVFAGTYDRETVYDNVLYYYEIFNTEENRIFQPPKPEIDDLDIEYEQSGFRNLGKPTVDVIARNRKSKNIVKKPEDTETSPGLENTLEFQPKYQPGMPLELSGTPGGPCGPVGMSSSTLVRDSPVPGNNENRTLSETDIRLMERTFSIEFDIEGNYINYGLSNFNEIWDNSDLLKLFKKPDNTFNEMPYRLLKKKAERISHILAPKDKRITQALNTEWKTSGTHQHPQYFFQYDYLNHGIISEVECFSVLISGLDGTIKDIYKYFNPENIKIAEELLSKPQLSDKKILEKAEKYFYNYVMKYYERGMGMWISELRKEKKYSDRYKLYNPGSELRDLKKEFYSESGYDVKSIKKVFTYPAEDSSKPKALNHNELEEYRLIQKVKMVANLDFSVFSPNECEHIEMIILIDSVTGEFCGFELL